MNKLKSTLLIAAWLISTFAMAQGGVSIGNWRTHLPYQKVIGVEPVGNKIYAATPYELIYYDTQDNSINILAGILGGVFYRPDMTYEEKRELRLQISQLLADAGLNQETLKEMAREELEKKSERAIEQVVEKSVKDMMPSMLRREIQKNL